MRKRKSKRHYKTGRNADGEMQVNFKIEDPEAFAVAVVNSSPDTPLDKVAKRAGIAQVVTRIILEEFQLYNMNYLAKNSWKMGDADIKEHYPIVAEFGGVKGTINAHCFKFRRSNVVKANQLCRWYSAPAQPLFTQKDVCKRLGIDPATHKRWTTDLQDVVESCNMQRVNEFGDSCGMSHSSEVLGSIGRSVIWTYLGTKCSQVVYEIVNGLGRVVTAAELIDLYQQQREAAMEIEREEIASRLHFWQYLFRSHLTPPFLKEEQVDWIHNYVNVTNVKDLTPYEDPFLEE